MLNIIKVSLKILFSANNIKTMRVGKEKWLEILL